MEIVSWTIFKTFFTAKGLNINWLDLGDKYWIKVVDNTFALDCILYKNPSDTTDLDDFVNNYKNASTANLPLTQLDTDGAQIVRSKAAKRGWSFSALAPEITTSTLGASLYCKDSSGTDVPGFTCKIYNASDVEITTAGVLNANLATAVKTVIDYEAAYDYELVGGVLRVTSVIGQDLRLWVVGAPDIPVAYGGSKEFATGINLKYLTPDSPFEIDGRVTKYIQYNASDHRGKVRIILKHPAGLATTLQFIFHLYKQ